MGTYLGKNVVDEASRALTTAMVFVAPRILHTRQVVAYLINSVQRKFLEADVPRYKPAFGECIDKFLIHAGEFTVPQGMLIQVAFAYGTPTCQSTCRGGHGVDVAAPSIAVPTCTLHMFP